MSDTFTPEEFAVIRSADSIAHGLMQLGYCVECYPAKHRMESTRLPDNRVRISCHRHDRPVYFEGELQQPDLKLHDGDAA